MCAHIAQRIILNPLTAFVCAAFQLSVLVSNWPTVMPRIRARVLIHFSQALGWALVRRWAIIREGALVS